MRFATLSVAPDRKKKSKSQARGKPRKQRCRIRNEVEPSGQKNLGWQACLEQDLLQRCQVRRRILAKAQLFAPSFAPKGELLTHGVPCLQISERQSSR